MVHRCPLGFFDNIRVVFDLIIPEYDRVFRGPQATPISSNRRLMALYSGSIGRLVTSLATLTDGGHAHPGYSGRTEAVTSYTLDSGN
jgi:hypothetical protein